MSKEYADLAEKAAFTILAVTRERDELREKIAQLEEASSRSEALDHIRPLVPEGRNTDEWLDSYLDNGGTFEGIKEARRLFPDVNEGFAPSGDSVSGAGSNSDAMLEVNSIVLGE